MVCKNCGTKIPMGGKFCPNCRWKVTKEKEDKIIRKPEITCSRCGAAIPEGGKFCPNCRCGYPVKPGGRDPKPLKDWWDVPTL